MAQHIRELNLGNHHALNWQIDDHLEEFIISICPHLEALHILDCGISFRRLHHILKQAPKLTALSWSLRDFTSEDIEFLVNSIQSCDGIRLKNIKHLHIETFQTLRHIQVVKYLVLSRCKVLEEIEIYTWEIDERYCSRQSFPLENEMIDALPQPSTSIADELQHLHSLTVVALIGRSYSCTLLCYHRIYEAGLYDFVSSVVGKKSRETKWKRLWIAPPVGISREEDLFHFIDYSLPLHEVLSHELQSVEAITARSGASVNAADELKTLLQRIDDNTVKSFHLCESMTQVSSILGLCGPILRIGGHALKFLSLSSFNPQHGIRAEENVSLHMLFSNCSNITELDLLYCYFEKDICEPLSKLSHLTKVQLMECAISSKHSKENQVEISKANLLTFVENCKKIKHFDVRGCGYHEHFSCHLTDGDLLALAKFINLKSLTLYLIPGIRKWAFLQNISVHCKFLTMLRIRSANKHINNSHIPNFLRSAKFLKHLALYVPELDLESEGFWNLLSCAMNLERLCIGSYCKELLINVPVAMEALKSLPQLHVLHLHSSIPECFKVFHYQMRGMLMEEKSDRRFFFELVTNSCSCMLRKSWISQKALPLNKVELCHITPILDIPNF